MSDSTNLVYICVHCGQVVENKDSEWHDRQCPAKNINLDDEQEDIELNVDEIDDETPEAKQQVEKEAYAVRLINAVKPRVLLWERYQKRDVPARQKLWAEIEQELGAEAGAARRDWNHIRDKYRSERAILNRAAKAGRPATSNWEYYNHLSFLEQNELPRPTTGTNSAPTIVSSKIVTVNGKKIITRQRGKPGPKPGTKKKKTIILKPITRSKREPKPTHSQSLAKITTPTTTAKMNELRVVVSRNDYLTNRQNMNSHSIMNDSSSRKRPQQTDLETTTLKQVCIRNNEQTQMNSTNDHDTVGKFCSYLEVMLRTLPKEKQEVFYEETLDHLATLKRQIRRSNHSNPATNYM
ncbi:uncharacterized protein LOC122510285 [Leptopilina heterotoma]|uniref:uncharacterized protein LOC122510285 n=1 Tax=Leptopilina heterotoma TaxID=63436 RepID=UPI001CA8DFD3|nr:uncharacterized protein LOC122510285 [Leptopilina heterotoma]